MSTDARITVAARALAEMIRRRIVAGLVVNDVEMTALRAGHLDPDDLRWREVEVAFWKHLPRVEGRPHGRPLRRCLHHAEKCA